ncbi:FUSC family protein [Labrenzia sp. 011]|uniref:FUSC family protein n=1 Tax=Labrenzia sp. 011 TaxID=2171494 RepID=UPI000D5127E0|nr:FUSC family protein [Labrenzia sp. 011]PVB60471.1 FUSC family protein [Labrenzia sp. 011]
MTRPAEVHEPAFLQRILRDLAPFPGRFQLTWQVALVCALAAAVSMTYRVPEASISLYLVIFLMKRDAFNNCVMGIGLILLATLVVAGMIPLINATIDSPAMRLAAMFTASFVFLYLSSATTLGEQAAIIGLIIAFILTLVTDVPVGEVADQGLLMAWKMVAVPMAVMFVFSLLAGPSPQRLVREKIVERLRLSADRIATGTAPEDLADLLGEGNQEALQRMKLARLLHLAPGAQTLWLTGAIETSCRILLAVAGLKPDAPADEVAELKHALTAAADRIEAGEMPPVADPESGTHGHGSTLWQLLDRLGNADGGATPEFVMPPLFAEDALSNPDHLRFALKTASAAILCYLIYTGIQWNGIHTAMITCYVASLGSVGETVHKLLLRIGGCLIGAALGVAALVLVMPHITSIGSLMALVFCGVFIGAWVSSGDERINYAGVQIALAFLLTVLNDFGPSFEFSQASDRIIGILVGNLAIYLMFTQVWPRSAFKTVVARISAAIASLDRAASQASPALRFDEVTQANVELAEAGRLMDTIFFEPASLKPSDDVVSRLNREIHQLRDLSIDLGTGSMSGEEAHSVLSSLGNFPSAPSSVPRLSRSAAELRS